MSKIQLVLKNLTVKRVLVTGGTGFIGKNLVEALRERGARVACLVRERSRPEALAFLTSLGAEVRYGDLRSPADAAAAVSGAHRVVHLAAKVSGQGWDEAAYHGANVLATQHLLAACRSEKMKRFVHVSTVGVYGPASEADERTPLSPVNVYERTKAEAEALVRQSGLPYAIVRPGLVFGPGARLVTLSLALARLGIVPLIGKADAAIQPIYVKDLAHLIETMLFSTRMAGETVIAAGRDRVSLRDFMAMLAPGRTLRFIPLPRQACHLACRLGDALERALRMDLLLNSRLYGTFTISGTYGTSKMERLLKVRLTPLAQALAGTRASHEHHSNFQNAKGKRASRTQKHPRPASNN